MLYIKELLSSSVENQKATIGHIASTLGLPPIVIEKDVWVTVLLHILFGENGSKGILLKMSKKANTYSNSFLARTLSIGTNIILESKYGTIYQRNKRRDMMKNITIRVVCSL